jgi:peptidoglycan/LPS O-acetylase OafA/YrhL
VVPIFPHTRGDAERREELYHDARMDPRIDRLRGLLAFGVMLGHASDLSLNSTQDRQGLIFFLVLNARPYLGFICVVGFIVLSGYCIARSTLTNYRVARYASRRVTRLYPLLITAVLFAGVVEWIAFGSPHRIPVWPDGVTWPRFGYALLGLSGFKGPFGSLAPTYTVSFELLYYVVWGGALWITRGRTGLGWLLAWMLALGLLVFGEAIRTTLGTQAGYAHPLAIGLLPAWLIGATLAIWQRPLTAIGRYLPPVWLLWIGLAWAFAYGLDTYEKPRVTPTDASDVVYFSVLSALLVVTMARWLSRPAVPNANDTWLGELSYPLFLFHGPAIMAIQFVVNASGLKLDYEPLLALHVTTSVLMAMLMTVLVERPLMAWRRRERVAPPVPIAQGEAVLQ